MEDRKPVESFATIPGTYPPMQVRVTDFESHDDSRNRAVRPRLTMARRSAEDPKAVLAAHANRRIQERREEKTRLRALRKLLPSE